MITVRLRPDLDQAARERAIELIRSAVDDPAFALREGSYVVSGVPVIFDGLAQKLSSEIFVLLAVALAMMAITLALVFGPPLRLLPLAVALAASAITFGLLALLGGSLTMASIAVLPVLTGLAVDYAIQFQARFAEALREGSSAPRAAVEAAARGGPVIATALLATTAGFAVLLLSPIPMIRSFGLLLVAGVAIAFALAVTAGLAHPFDDPECHAVVGRPVGRAGGAVPGEAVRSGRSSLGVGAECPRRVDRDAGAGAGGGAGACGSRVDRRHEDRADLRHPPAAARRPARAPGRRRARARHRPVRRRLRLGRRPGPRRPGADRLDGVLPGPHPRSPRLLEASSPAAAARTSSSAPERPSRPFSAGRRRPRAARSSRSSRSSPTTSPPR